MSSGYGNYYSASNLPFNSTFAYLERMERRWEDADLAKARGDTIAYFRALETIFRNAHPFFDKKEKTVEILRTRKVGVDDNGKDIIEDYTIKVTEIEACENFVQRIESYLQSSGDKAFKSAGLWVGENQCDRFRMLLVSLLFKYKITYAKKEKIVLEDEVEDDY